MSGIQRALLLQKKLFLNGNKIPKKLEKTNKIGLK